MHLPFSRNEVCEFGLGEPGPHIASKGTEMTSEPRAKLPLRPPSNRPVEPKRILIVDDEPALLRLYTRALGSAGYEVVAAGSAEEAMSAIKESHLDAVLTDIHLPGARGTALLQRFQAERPELPVLLMTGSPAIETAVEAVELGAVRYLRKPFEIDHLLTTIADVLRGTASTAQQRASSRMRIATARQREKLDAELTHALDQVWIAYQPIISTKTRAVAAYEALIRSNDKVLSNPFAILTAAEALGRMHDVGRTVRERAPAPFEPGGDSLLFVNVHPHELLDDALYVHDCPLAKIASRVVLEITERASLEEVAGLSERLDVLRELGYRIAIDDLGAGHSGLATLATVRPDLVKLDMVLVRDIHENTVKQKVVRSIVNLTRDLGITAVAEGVEVEAERDVLLEIGCDYLQGYLFAKPGKPLPTALSW